LIKKLLAIVLSLVICSICTFGCGNSSSEAASLTKAQFIKRGEAICNEAELEQLKGANAYASKHPGAEEEDLVVPVILPPIEKELEGLEALGVPKGDEEAVQKFLTSLEAAVKQSRESPGDLFAAETDPFTKPDKLAEEYGFDVCGNNP
jgi:hypothetical protein